MFPLGGTFNSFCPNCTSTINFHDLFSIYSSLFLNIISTEGQSLTTTYYSHHSTPIFNPQSLSCFPYLVSQHLLVSGWCDLLGYCLYPLVECQLHEDNNLYTLFITISLSSESLVQIFNIYLLKYYHTSITTCFLTQVRIRNLM